MICLTTTTTTTTTKTDRKYNLHDSVRFSIFMLYQSADAGAGTEKPFLDKRLPFAKKSIH